MEAAVLPRVGEKGIRSVGVRDDYVILGIAQKYEMKSKGSKLPSGEHMGIMDTVYEPM